MNELTKIYIHTDGACSGNPGPGGWCSILVYNETEKEISGSEAWTTNNQMELKSVIEALKMLNRPCEISLYSDSQYVVNSINEWLPGWIKTNFKGKKNVDMWREYLELSKNHKITAIHVKAHNGDYYNERCDKVAYNLAQSQK